MKKLIKRITLTLASAGILLLPLLIPATAQAQAGDTTIQQSLCAGADLSASNIQGADCSKGDPGSTIDSKVRLAINVFSWVVGVASVFMIMIGGFMYITSGGKSESVSRAKDTILYAVIGLVVVAIAQIIVKFVLGQVTTNS